MYRSYGLHMTPKTAKCRRSRLREYGRWSQLGHLRDPEALLSNCERLPDLLSLRC